MSDDDRDIDVESDEGDDSDSRQTTPRPNIGGQYYSQAEKRAHHNALERKRRDHIKDSFSSLRDSVPALNGEKASRAQILKKAAEYILFMRKKNSSHQQDIEDLKRQNNLLEAQIRTLEKAKSTGSFGMDSDAKDSIFNETESDTSDADSGVPQRQTKKMKIGSYH
ncbi:unnamed protein product [Acanthoscelides obtectus]|uniref:Protein max n=1 Tax=Acanthoscelides obtectus TaxID=200917 RepID=A0A9P0Q394_ACAOB|nr:unnamed protein product [Acanthoscelides obtectus]CAK1643905.1 Protein max [Acanthoscelides obtectus]